MTGISEVNCKTVNPVCHSSIPECVNIYIYIYIYIYIERDRERERACDNNMQTCINIKDIVCLTQYLKSYINLQNYIIRMEKVH